MQELFAIARVATIARNAARKLIGELARSQRVMLGEESPDASKEYMEHRLDQLFMSQHELWCMIDENSAMHEQLVIAHHLASLPPLVCMNGVNASTYHQLGMYLSRDFFDRLIESEVLTDDGQFRPNIEMSELPEQCRGLSKFKLSDDGELHAGIDAEWAHMPGVKEHRLDLDFRAEFHSLVEDPADAGNDRPIWRQRVDFEIAFKRRCETSGQSYVPKEMRAAYHKQHEDDPAEKKDFDNARMTARKKGYS